MSRSVYDLPQLRQVWLIVLITSVHFLRKFPGGRDLVCSLGKKKNIYIYIDGRSGFKVFVPGKFRTVGLMGYRIKVGV